MIQYWTLFQKLKHLQRLILLLINLQELTKKDITKKLIKAKN
jgi:hypothetical protein